ncbi:MAG: RusA family crossover junction endodeoxyribonuclease [Planctomycetota bacterium]
MIELRLPWPPSANHYYRRVGNRTLISKPGRLYRRTVVAMLRPRFPVAMTGRLTVTIYAHPPDRRRRDLDNIQKCLLDSLQHAGVYGDDSQIDSLSIHRCNPVPDGSVRLSIIESALCS